MGNCVRGKIRERNGSPGLTLGYDAAFGHDAQLPALALGLAQVTAHHALRLCHNPIHDQQQPW
jgi:hypothetical protein